MYLNSIALSAAISVLTAANLLGDTPLPLAPLPPLAELTKEKVAIYERKLELAESLREVGALQLPDLQEAKIDLLEARFENATDLATRKLLLEQQIVIISQLLDLTRRGYDDGIFEEEEVLEARLRKIRAAIRLRKLIDVDG